MIDNESIVYTPAVEYKDRDELIYKVTESAGEIVSYGLLSFHDYGEVTIQKIPGSSAIATSLFFVDENTGFLGTSAGLYKTTDGGTNWNVVVSYGQFRDISFADAQNGVAAYTSFDYGGLMKTKDGGATWKEIDFNYLFSNGPVASVALTSEMTGFIAVSEWIFLEGEDTITTRVLKTENGGVTWKEVLTDRSMFGQYYDYNIQFINHTTGYAILPEKIFVTHDAGETWDVLPDATVNHFHTIQGNKIFGVVDGAIVTSHDGSQWRPVADDFLSNIHSIGFSPSGEIGFVVAQVSDAPQIHNGFPLQPILIFKTVDKGETWVQEIMDEPLLGSYPLGISIPSDSVAYFLCQDRIIKYSQ